MAEKNKKRGRFTSLTGTVVRTNGDKTAIVDVVTIKKHLVYNRSIKKRVRYVVHDGNNQCEVGDKALIYESKPVSKTKRWRVGKIVEKSRPVGAGDGAGQ
ncbi:MAG: 30S ribosomal protein S17 [Candidatus Mycalebacterium zealandia]|nr:MAG: 30S ribosomal protein S17 [Candidatus Mycalebacterium zealandia]